MNGHYERLSGLDNSFLLLESANAHMHIAATAIFEPGSLGAPGGGVDIDRIQAYVASRMHLLPRYRQRLAYVPLVQEPAWVDDERFDLAFHVRHTSLPRPGTEAQLRQLCARILERQLDRQRPLWEMWIIEGLQGGGFAMLSKVHHCMVDGLGGVELLAALLDPTPTSEVSSERPWTPRPAPSDDALLRSEALRRARGALGLMANVRSFVRSPTRLPASLRGRASAVAALVKTGLRPTSPPGPLNAAISPHRRVAWFAFELDHVKAVKRVLGGTVNDVLLATVAGAMDRFLCARSTSRAKHDLRVAVPVSIRGSDDREAAGNHVAAWIVPLPVGEADPARRLDAVREATTHLKQTNQADGVHALASAAEWTGSNLLGLALRLIGRTRPYDLIVTNVSGPDVPLYLLDAPMVSAYPHMPLFEGQGLGIALFSYRGRLHWGLTGDWQLVPDLDRLAVAVETSFAELCETAARAGKAAEVRAPRPLGASHAEIPQYPMSVLRVDADPLPVAESA